MEWRNPNENMTLGEGTRLLRGAGWACACVGPPIPSPKGTPCFCRLSFGQAHALNRAAHIVAKLLAENGEAIFSCENREAPPQA